MDFVLSLLRGNVTVVRKIQRTEAVAPYASLRTPTNSEWIQELDLVCPEHAQ